MANHCKSNRSGCERALLAAVLGLTLLSPAWTGEASAWPSEQAPVAVEAAALGPETDSARPPGEVPILLAKDKSEQLDVGDERPIGDQGIMRGKKDLFGKRRVEGPPDNSMLDLGIWICGGALLVLLIFAFTYRPAPKAPQSDY